MPVLFSVYNVSNVLWVAATMNLRLLLPLLLLGSAHSMADTLFKCQNTDGRTIYTNQKTGKNCEIVSQDKPVTTFSSPAQKAKQPTPADFPRVGGDQQKNRDNDRRAILEQELGNEQKNLAEAKRTLAEQENLILPEERAHGAQGSGINQGKREARIQSYRDKILLHERNLESIRKEIANLK
jgi:hypothetical protein